MGSLFSKLKEQRKSERGESMSRKLSIRKSQPAFTDLHNPDSPAPRKRKSDAKRTKTSGRMGGYRAKTEPDLHKRNELSSSPNDSSSPISSPMGTPNKVSTLEPGPPRRDSLQVEDADSNSDHTFDQTPTTILTHQKINKSIHKTAQQGTPLSPSSAPSHTLLRYQGSSPSINNSSLHGINKFLATPLNNDFYEDEITEIKAPSRNPRALMDDLDDVESPTEPTASENNPSTTTVLPILEKQKSVVLNRRQSTLKDDSLDVFAVNDIAASLPFILAPQSSKKSLLTDIETPNSKTQFNNFFLEK